MSSLPILDVPLASNDVFPAVSGNAIMMADDDFDDSDHQSSSYIAMESTPDVHITPQTVNSASEHDQYVSLNISGDSDESKKKSVYHKTTKQLAKAYATIMKEEAALTRTIADIRLPGPITESDVRDIEQALMGDYKDEYYQEPGEMVWMPQATAFEDRLKNSKVDNLNIDSAARRYRFLVPFIIKAELNPGLAFGEGILTWIHFLSLFSLFYYGFSVVASIIGGLALFISLNITHFWYGLSRYPSVWNNMVPKDLKGSKLDENFSEIRDVSSYFCNGHNKTKPQLGAFIISLPFTFLYHVNAFVATIAYFLCGIPKDGSRFPSPISFSICVTNIMMVCLWFLGGRLGCILSTAAKIFNQNFYNSLLFKRSLKDFLLSFVFGNVLVVQDKRPDRIGAVINGREDSIATAKQMASEIDLENGENLESQRDLSPTTKHDTIEIDESVPKSSDVDVLSMSSAGNSLVDRSVGEDPNEVRISVEENRGNEADSQGNQSQLCSEDSVSRHRLQHLATIENAGSSENADTSIEERKSLKSLHENGSRSLSRTIPSRSQNIRKKEPEVSNEFLIPSDIYLDIENHPGTVAFRNVVNDAIAKFPTKSYTFRKHNWILRKLHGRYFFLKKDGEGRQKLGRADVKKYCKLFHDKQTLLRSEIAGILTDLKDLKRNHTNSKSNSDHSRNSKTIPLEITEKLSGILKNNSSHDQNESQNRRRDPNAESKQNLECASTAKDSQVESHVESSKESTISTLTQSNATFPDSRARSTPWMKGPAAELKDLSEDTPSGGSNHLRDAINGLLEYTSWLENLNPLRESSVTDQANANLKELSEQEGDELLAKRQQSGILTAGTTGANTGGVDKPNDPYWHELVDEPPKKKKFMANFPRKATDIEDREEDHPYNSDLPLNTLNLNTETGKFVDAADVHTEEPSKHFPLWRRALRKSKKKKKQTQNESPNKQEKKRGPSFWRKKRAADPYDNAEPEKPSKQSMALDPPATKYDATSPAFDERQDNGKRETMPPRASDGITFLPNANAAMDRRQDDPMLSPEFDQLLETMNDEFLRRWGEESLSMRDATSAGSSAYEGTNPSVKGSTIESFGYCGKNSCDAFGACALPHGSTDVDDEIFDNE